MLFGDSLFVQVLHGMKTDDPSYILRISKANGRTIWRQERPTIAQRESPDSYTTPAIVRYGNNLELVITGGDAVTGHDVNTGKELWRADALNPTNDLAYRIVASPVVHGELIIAPSRERPMLVMRPGGRGDVAKSHIMWEFQNGPDVPTPVTDGTYVYVVNDRGIMWCLDAKTGKEIYGKQRLRPSTYSGSFTLADGKLYITNEDGLTTVVRAGPKFEILAENNFDDYTLSSPAVSDGQIFIRTTGWLWAIGNRTTKN
jgi:outer membrane protein assembly factor BamB